MTLASPASHGIHLQVDVLDVTKGSEILFDIGVLRLLIKDVKERFSRLETALVSMAPLRGSNFKSKITTSYKVL